jgi:transposase
VREAKNFYCLYLGMHLASLSKEVKGLSKKQLLKENQELREENARLRQEIELLRQKMDLLVRRVFGRSSEKLDAGQLDLFLMTPENEPGKVDASSLEEADPRHEPRSQRGTRCRERWPADLPVLEEIIDPKEVQKAPQNWRLIGAEVSEQLDYEPGRFLRRRLVRRKYVRRGDPEATPVIAALPPSLQERCIAAPGLLAQIIVSKYCDHLPLYRQEAIFENRQGFTCHVRTWPAGWGWPLIGCDPFMSIFAPESWPEDTSRLTRLRFAICLQATAKPSSVISGPRYHLGAMWSITGKQAEEQTALKT